jgi:hypothetical protein
VRRILHWISKGRRRILHWISKAGRRNLHLRLLKVFVLWIHSLSETLIQRKLLGVLMELDVLGLNLWNRT